MVMIGLAFATIGIVMIVLIVLVVYGSMGSLVGFICATPLLLSVFFSIGNHVNDLEAVGEAMSTIKIRGEHMNNTGEILDLILENDPDAMDNPTEPLKITLNLMADSHTEWMKAREKCLTHQSRIERRKQGVTRYVTWLLPASEQECI